ncbi:hypothetical protein V8E53_008823 [Lactarius tabidus]
MSILTTSRRVFSLRSLPLPHTYRVYAQLTTSLTRTHISRIVASFALSEPVLSTPRVFHPQQFSEFSLHTIHAHLNDTTASSIVAAFASSANP